MTPNCELISWVCEINYRPHPRTLIVIDLSPHHITPITMRQIKHTFNSVVSRVYLQFCFRSYFISFNLQQYNWAANTVYQKPLRTVFKNMFLNCNCIVWSLNYILKIIKFFFSRYALKFLRLSFFSSYKPFIWGRIDFYRTNSICIEFLSFPTQTHWFF